MDAVQKTRMTKDEIIKELMDLLKQNNMPKEANDTFEVAAYIDGLEKKLDEMSNELTSVKQQLKEMQEDTTLNNLKIKIQEASERLEKRCSVMKEELFTVRSNMKEKATEIVTETKKKGKAALNRVSELFKIKEHLVSIRGHVKESQKEVAETIHKIDAFGVGMREANQKIANTFRTFADKPEVVYSKNEKKITKTELFKKPWLAKKKILDSMVLRLDAAIDKVENLSMDVQIDKMEQTYKELSEKAHQKMAEQEPAAFALVAEAEAQYGSEAFEAYQSTKGSAGVESNLTESSKMVVAEKGEKCR